jgi:flagellar M-ring protein FliF
LSASQLEVRKQVEQYLEEKSQSMLDNVLGPDKSVIRVTAELNFQQVEQTNENYDPNAPSIRSEERTKATTTANDKAGENDESQKDDATETTITNYELNKSVEHIINAVGTINRLSVAVMVDGVYEPVGDGEEGAAPVYQPRSQEELDRLAAIVQNAVGFDSQRNDQIEMYNIAFDRTNFMDDRDKLDAMYLREFYMDIATKVGLVLLAVLGFLYFRKKARKLFRNVGSLMPPRRVAPPQPMAAESVAPIEEEVVEPIQPEKRKPRLVDQMQKTAKDRPDEIARVIKTLMID